MKFAQLKSQKEIEAEERRAATLTIVKDLVACFALFASGYIALHLSCWVFP